MNNKLTLFYDLEKSIEVRTKTREAVKQQYGFSEYELVSIGGGFKFLYDDETNGEVAITFIEEKDALRVTVEGTWSWEVIDVYYNCLPQSAEEDPA